MISSRYDPWKEAVFTRKDIKLSLTSLFIKVEVVRINPSLDLVPSLQT